MLAQRAGVNERLVWPETNTETGPVAPKAVKLGDHIVIMRDGRVVAFSRQLPNRLQVAGTGVAFQLMAIPAGGGDARPLVANDGAASCQVFGQGTDTIDNVATATGVAIAAAKRRPIRHIMLNTNGIRIAEEPDFVKQLAVTPPLLATFAGMGFALMGWTLPVAVDQTFSALGQMALPLGLLGVGGDPAYLTTHLLDFGRREQVVVELVGNTWRVEGIEVGDRFDGLNSGHDVSQGKCESSPTLSTVAKTDRQRQVGNADRHPRCRRDVGGADAGSPGDFLKISFNVKIDGANDNRFTTASSRSHRCRHKVSAEATLPSANPPPWKKTTVGRAGPAGPGRYTRTGTWWSPSTACVSSTPQTAGGAQRCLAVSVARRTRSRACSMGNENSAGTAWARRWSTTACSVGSSATVKG